MISTVRTVRASFSGVTVTLDGLPVSTCVDATHERRFATPNYRPQLIRHVLSNPRFGVATSGALARPRCTHCRSGTWVDRGGVSRRSALVTIPGVPPVQVTVAGPALHCAKCGREHLTEASVVGEAVLEALRLAQLRR